MSLEKLIQGKTETIGTNTLEYALDGVGFRAASYLGNLPSKLMLFSKDVGNYPREKTQGYISSYLTESGLENITVRVGHNRVFRDVKRLFTDKKLKDISLLGRIFLGIPATLFGGIQSKLTRGDYYNPFTRTAVIYSDVPAIALHELGHAKDYQNVGKPSLYSLARYFYIGRIIQEFRASKMAHDYIKSKDPKEKTMRYLAPAFATYLL